MSSDDELPLIIKVDNNNVICQAAKSPNEHTVIILVTPKDAWVKKLVVSATGVFGHEIECGDNAGEPMHGLNANMKFSSVDLGENTGNVAIQFLKPKFAGVYTNFDTRKIPNSLQGYTIAFFWPNDAGGDHWETFINNVTQTKRAVGEVGGVAKEVLQVGQSAATFLALFA